MSDTADRLVYMANQIARAFQPMSSEGEAVLATADHIKMYWDPRMINGIKHCDQEALTPIARRALAIVYQPVPHVTGGTEFASVNATDGGHNDAG
jgi:formate dehydrogenase subunit delta